MKNNEAARRYRSRKRAELETRQKTWELMQDDVHTALKLYCHKHRNLLLALLHNDKKRKLWTKKLQKFNYKIKPHVHIKQESDSTNSTTSNY